MLNKFAGLAVLALATSAHAAIISNDFSTVTPGIFANATAFGADAVLGVNVRNPVTVAATGGVGNSAAITDGSDVFVRSTVTHSTIATTTFSSYFRFDPRGSSIGGFFGMGWSTAGGVTSGQSPYSNANQNDRFLVGLSRGNSNVMSLATSGSMESQTLIPTPGGGEIFAATATVNNWYQMSFSLLFNRNTVTPADSTWTVSDLLVRDWGTDGVTGGGTVLNLTSRTIDPTTYAANLNNQSAAHAVVIENYDRGARALDNIQIIPEPSSFALGAAALLVLGFRRRRNG